MANQRLAIEERFGIEAPPSNLMDLLQFWARRSGERHVYTFQRDDGHETTLTYAMLDRRAKAIAARLQQTCQRGDRALLLYPAGLDFIAAFCGCAYAGVLAVPVCYPKPKRPMPRLQSISQDAAPTVALTNHKTLEQFDFHLVHSELPSEAWIASDDTPDELAESWTAPSLAPGDIAFLQYTSGSTSDPKGVMVSHGNLLHNLEVIRSGFGLDFDLQAGEPRNKGVFWLPAYHDMGLIGGILTTMYVGGHSLLMSPGAFLQRPARWLEAISETHASISGAPNFAFDLCVSKVTEEKRGALDLRGWEVCFCGAEPIRAETLASFSHAFRESGFRPDAFYPCYGLAENTLMAAGGNGPAPPHIEVVQRKALAENRFVEAQDDAQPVREVVSCGGAVLDQQVAIVDSASQERLPDGCVGEIWIKGRSVAQGYWNRPQETQFTFQARLANGEGPFLRTGDLGVVADGRLYVTGRVKDVVIIRGRNHYPEDIERTVERCHEALRPNAGVAASVDVNDEESLVVIHEVDRAYRDLDLSEVVRKIRRAVAEEHEIHPQAIVLIRHASLPITTSGKVQRSLAKKLYLAEELKVLQEWVASPPGTAVSRNGAENGNDRPAYLRPLTPKDRANGFVKHGNGHAKAPESNGNGHATRPAPNGKNGHGTNGASHNGAHANGNHKNGVHKNGSRLNGVTTNGESQNPVKTSNEAHADSNGHHGNGHNGNGHNGNGHVKGSKIPRIEFDHFPLSASEIDRLAERIEKWILDWLVERAAVHPSDIDRHKPFAEYGMDSLTAVEMSHGLEEWLGVELTAVVAWNYPTPHKISRYLADAAGGAETPELDAGPDAETSSEDDFERLLAEIENLSESEAQNALSRNRKSA